MGDLTHSGLDWDRPVRVFRGRLAALQTLESKTAVLAFLLMVAYWPGMAGAATALRWGLLWSVIPFLSRWPRIWGFYIVPVSAGVIYPCFTLLWAPSMPDGILEICLLVTFLASMLLRCDLRKIFLVSAYGIGLNSVIAVIQWMGYQPVITLTQGPSGLFLNANILAETASLVFVGVVSSAFRRKGLAESDTVSDVIGCSAKSRPPPWTRIPSWLTANKWTMLAVLLILPSLLLPHHRGSMIALGIAGMIWLIQKWRYGSLIAAAILVQSAFLFLGFKLYSDVSPWIFLSVPSLSERFEIWHATFTGLTWFGHGAGSFRSLFPVYAAPFIDTLQVRPLHAHNDLLELIFEYGIFASIPAAIAGLCLASRSPMRYVVIVFLVEGCLEFPLYMPATGFLAALCAGHCLRDWNSNRIVELWRRMALYVRCHESPSWRPATGGAAVSDRSALS